VNSFWTVKGGFEQELVNRILIIELGPQALIRNADFYCSNLNLNPVTS